jgi:hypothetical protein
METSLTITEADKMLSEIAGERHLTVKIRNGTPFYSPPGRSNPEPENRE